MTKPCIAKKLYEATTPYVQFIGWLAVAIPALYVAFCFIRDTSAYGDAITNLNAKYERLADKDAERDNTIAIMQQEVHDIHEFLIKDIRHGQ